MALHVGAHLAGSTPASIGKGPLTIVEVGIIPRRFAVTKERQRQHRCDQLVAETPNFRSTFSVPALAG